jgi:hypothetical protein
VFPKSPIAAVGRRYRLVIALVVVAVAIMIPASVMPSAMMPVAVVAGPSVHAAGNGGAADRYDRRNNHKSFISHCGFLIQTRTTDGVGALFPKEPGSGVQPTQPATCSATLFTATFSAAPDPVSIEPTGARASNRRVSIPVPPARIRIAS